MNKKTISLMMLMLFLAACGDKSLYSGLSEQEVNEMVALLQNSGIASSKRQVNDQAFSISVQDEYFSPAVALLRANGYPRNKFESLGEVFQKEGFVSSPLEERARLNYAQSQELAKTIESIDGVILARVHLALPKEDPLSDVEKPSSASVFIKHRRGIDLGSRESQIKALIVNSIEDLVYENVTVALFPTESVPANYQIKKQMLKPESMSSPLLIISALVGVLLLVTIVLALWWWQRKNTLFAVDTRQDIDHVNRKNNT